MQRQKYLQELNSLSVKSVHVVKIQAWWRGVKERSNYTALSTLILTI
jgi:hypothetical protein